MRNVRAGLLARLYGQDVDHKGPEIASEEIL